MPRFSPRRQAILWGVLGTAMLLFGFWKPWFILDLGGFRFPLGVLLVIYAGLQFTIHMMSRGQVVLSDDEVAEWGDRLEEATPLILEELEKGRSVSLVVERVQEAHGIPPHVTQRYIIVLLRMVKQDERELLVPREDNSDDE